MQLARRPGLDGARHGVQRAGGALPRGEDARAHGDEAHAGAAQLAAVRERAREALGHVAGGADGDDERPAGSSSKAKCPSPSVVTTRASPAAVRAMTVAVGSARSSAASTTMPVRPWSARARSDDNSVGRASVRPAAGGTTGTRRRRTRLTTQRRQRRSRAASHKPPMSSVHSGETT